MILKNIKFYFQLILILLLDSSVCIDSFDNVENLNGRAMEPYVTKLSPVYNNVIDRKVDLDLEHIAAPNDFINLMKKIKNISYGLRILIDRLKSYLPKLEDNQSLLYMPTAVKFLIGKRYLLDGVKILLKSLEQYITGRYLENFTEKQTGRLFGAVFPRVFNTYNYYVPELNLGRCSQVYVRQFLPPYAEFKKKFDDIKEYYKESFDAIVDFWKHLYLNIYYKIKHFYIKKFLLPKLTKKQKESVIFPKDFELDLETRRTIKTLPEHIMRIKRNMENEKTGNSLDEFSEAHLGKNDESNDGKNKKIINDKKNILNENKLLDSENSNIILPELEKNEIMDKNSLKKDFWPGLDISEIDFYNVFPESQDLPRKENEINEFNPNKENEANIVIEIPKKEIEIDIDVGLPTESNPAEGFNIIDKDLDKVGEEDKNKDIVIEKVEVNLPVEIVVEQQPQPAQEESQRFPFSRCIALYSIEAFARFFADRFVGAGG